MTPRVYSIEELRCNAYSKIEKSLHICELRKFLREGITQSQIHRHDAYMVLVATTGRGTHVIDFTTYSIQPGYVFLTYPSMIHEWKAQQELDGFLIFFTDAFFSLRYNTNNLLEFPFFRSIKGKPLVIFPQDQSFDQITTLCEWMLMEYTYQEADATKVLRSYLNILLHICKRKYTRLPPIDCLDTHARSIIKQFEQLIDQHYEDRRLVRDYAELLQLSPNYLNTICKKVTGKSAGELIRSRIMIEARRMLLHEDSTVSEISHALHFVDNSYFCRFFKKYEGVSPEQFRRQFLHN